MSMFYCYSCMQYKDSDFEDFYIVCDLTFCEACRPETQVTNSSSKDHITDLGKMVKGGDDKYTFSEIIKGGERR